MCISGVLPVFERSPNFPAKLLLYTTGMMDMYIFGDEVASDIRPLYHKNQGSASEPSLSLVTVTYRPGLHLRENALTHSSCHPEMDLIPSCPSKRDGKSDTSASRVVTMDAEATRAAEAYKSACQPRSDPTELGRGWPGNCQSMQKTAIGIGPATVRKSLAF
jgi:hypothetical protein